MLGDDLRQLSQKAYTDLDARAHEALALNQLCKYISLEMKCRCIDKVCETVADAIRVIERYEAILGDYIDKKKTAVRHVSEFHADVEDEFQNVGLQQSTARMLETSNDSIAQIQPTRNSTVSMHIIRRNTSINMNCYICESPGHYFRNCPVYKKCMQELSNKPSIQNARQASYSNRKPQGNFKPSM